MSDTIKIKGGTGDVPSLGDRELGYDKTNKILYIGHDGEGNVELCDPAKVERMYSIIIELSVAVDELKARINALHPPEE